jgi:hypothetical protein
MDHYPYIPDDALIRMARKSYESVEYWTRSLDTAKESVNRAERALKSAQTDRDGFYESLDAREIPAPDSTVWGDA